MVTLKDPKFKVGDRVRVLYFGGETPRYRELQMGKYFTKKYEKRDEAGKLKRQGKGIVKAKGGAPFSEEIFEVSKVLLGDPVVYNVYSEEAGYELFGIFYAEELSLVREKEVSLFYKYLIGKHSG